MKVISSIQVIFDMSINSVHNLLTDSTFGINNFAEEIFDVFAGVEGNYRPSTVNGVRWYGHVLGRDDDSV